MAHGEARNGKWRGNWRMEWVASTLHTTSEHVVSSITTADAHTSAPSSRLNWRPCRFKLTRPFRRKTKYDFCACAVTFQTQSTTWTWVIKCTPWHLYPCERTRYPLNIWLSEPYCSSGGFGKEKKCLKRNIHINNLAFNETAASVLRDEMRRKTMWLCHRSALYQSCIYSQKWSWRWASLSPGTCRADPNR